MAHFAEIRSDDNKVLRVVVINNEDVANNGGEYSSESETWVANNIPNDLTLELDPYPETYWKQTSYNTRDGNYHTQDENGFFVLSDDQTKAKRFRYAIQSGTYDSAEDIFIDPKPFPSWTFNNTTKAWDPPTPMPNEVDDNGLIIIYDWNEETQTWEVR
tara:strand:- start:4579 stop:5055 length:477 start_codon:yes stop_codon:yes gene_type:complete